MTTGSGVKGKENVPDAIKENCTGTNCISFKLVEFSIAGYEKTFDQK